jgi:hypothetical protein
MTLTRWTRRLAPLALSLALAAGYAPLPAHAQEPAPEAAGDTSGRPVDGYILTAILAFVALFVVAKSARR